VRGIFNHDLGAEFQCEQNFDRDLADSVSIATVKLSHRRTRVHRISFDKTAPSKQNDLFAATASLMIRCAEHRTRSFHVRRAPHDTAMRCRFIAEFLHTGRAGHTIILERSAAQPAGATTAALAACPRIGSSPGRQHGILELGENEPSGSGASSRPPPNAASSNMRAPGGTCIAIAWPPKWKRASRMRFVPAT